MNKMFITRLCNRLSVVRKNLAARVAGNRQVVFFEGHCKVISRDFETVPLIKVNVISGVIVWALGSLEKAANASIM